MSHSTKRRTYRYVAVTAILFALGIWSISVLAMTRFELTASRPEFIGWQLALESGCLKVKSPNNTFIDHLSRELDHSLHYELINQKYYTIINHKSNHLNAWIYLPTFDRMQKSRFYRRENFGFRMPTFERRRPSKMCGYEQQQPQHAILTIPLGWPAVFFTVLSVYVLHRIRCYPRGHCQACGYNLTNNTTGTCPECGTRDATNTSPSVTP